MMQNVFSITFISRSFWQHYDTSSHMGNRTSSATSAVA